MRAQIDTLTTSLEGFKSSAAVSAAAAVAAAAAEAPTVPQAQHDELLAAHDALQQRVTSLQSELEAAQAQVASAASASATVAAETQRYQHAIRAADARIHELEVESEAGAQLRATHADTTAALGEARSKLVDSEETLRRLREAAATEKKKSKEATTKATERMAVLEQELFELRNNEAKLKAKLAAAVTKAAAADASVAAAPAAQSSPSSSESIAAAAAAAASVALAQSEAALESTRTELSSRTAALAEAQARANRAEEALEEQARAHEKRMAQLHASSLPAHPPPAVGRRISFDGVGGGHSSALLLSPPPQDASGSSSSGSPILTAMPSGGLNGLASSSPLSSSATGTTSVGDGQAQSKDAFLLAQLQARQKQFKTEFLQVLSLLEAEQKKTKELLAMQRLDEARHRARVNQLEGLLGLEGLAPPETRDEELDAAEAREQRRREMMMQQRAAEADAQKRRAQQQQHQQHSDGGADVAIEIDPSASSPDSTGSSSFDLALSLPEREGSELQLRGVSLRSGDDLDRAEAYSVQVLAEIQHRIAVIEARFDHVATLVQSALGAIAPAASGVAAAADTASSAADSKLTRGGPPSPSQVASSNGLATVALSGSSSLGGPSSVSPRDYATAVSNELVLLRGDFSSLLRLLQHLDAHQATVDAYIHNFAERWQNQQSSVLSASKQLLLACVQPCVPFLARYLPSNVVSSLSTSTNGNQASAGSGRMRRVASNSELASLRSPTHPSRSKLRTPHKGSSSSEVKYAEI
jgi:hypothetical protein